MPAKKPSTIKREGLEAYQGAVNRHEALETRLAENVAERERKAETSALGYQALQHIEDEVKPTGVDRHLEVQSPHLGMARQDHE